MRINKRITAVLLCLLLLVQFLPFAFADDEDPTDAGALPEDPPVTGDQLGDANVTKSVTVVPDGEDIILDAGGTKANIEIYFGDAKILTLSAPTTHRLTKAELRTLGITDQPKSLYVIEPGVTKYELCKVKLRTDDTAPVVNFYKYTLEPPCTHLIKNIPEGVEYLYNSSWCPFHASTVKAAFPGTTLSVRYGGISDGSGDVPVFTLASPVNVIDEKIEQYGVFVGVAEFTSVQNIINCTSGTATFNPETNELTLHNATIKPVKEVAITEPSEKVYASIYSTIPITIITDNDGSNISEIKPTDSYSSHPIVGILCLGDLTIKGETLHITNENKGNSFIGIAANNLTLSTAKDSRVFISSNGTGKIVTGIECNDLKILKSDSGETITTNLEIALATAGSTVGEDYSGIVLNGNLQNNGNLMVEMGEVSYAGSPSVGINITGTGKITALDGTICLERYGSTEGSKILFCNKTGDALAFQRCRVLYDKDATKEVSYEGGWPADLFSKSGVSSLLIEGNTPVHAKSIEINSGATSINLEPAQTSKLTATVHPTNSEETASMIVWTSDNEAVATVSSDGTVTGVAEGSATITGTITFLESNGTISSTITATVQTAPIAPTSIDVYQTEGKSQIDLNSSSTTLPLTYTLEPTGATTTVTWTSSAESVATVDNTGLVTGVSEGAAVITATTTNGLDDSFEVTVVRSAIPPTSIRVYQSEGKNEIDLNSSTKTLPLSYSLEPTGATTTVTWTSNAESVATVDNNGVITGKAVGSAVITGTTANGKTGTFTVVVKQSSIVPTSIRIYQAEGKSVIDLNTSTTTLPLSVAIEPTGTQTSIRWKSSNTAAATVSDSGIVTGVAPGTAVISATTSNGLTDMFTVTVKKDVPVDSIIITKGGTIVVDPISVSVGETITVYAQVSPDTATNKEVTWTTSNNSVKLTPNGNTCAITGVSPMTENITVTATSKSNPKIEDFVFVTVASLNPVLTKATGDAVFTSLSGTKTLGVTVYPEYMKQFIVWEIVGTQGICTCNRNTTDFATAAVKPLAVGSTTVRAYVMYNGSKVGNSVDFTVTVSNAGYAITKPSVNNSLIWYYDSSSKAGTSVETNIPKALITKVTIGEVSIPITTSSSTGYCTITEIAGGTRLDIAYSWLKNTLLNKDSKYYLKVYYGTGSNDYVWKYIYVRSVRSSPVTGDENMSGYFIAFTGCMAVLTCAGLWYLTKGKKKSSK